MQIQHINNTKTVTEIHISFDDEHAAQVYQTSCHTFRRCSFDHAFLFGESAASLVYDTQHHILSSQKSASCYRGAHDEASPITWEKSVHTAGMEYHQYVYGCVGAFWPFLLFCKHIGYMKPCAVCEYLNDEN